MSKVEMLLTKKNLVLSFSFLVSVYPTNRSESLFNQMETNYVSNYLVIRWLNLSTLETNVFFWKLLSYCSSFCIAVILCSAAWLKKLVCIWWNAKLFSMAPKSDPGLVITSLVLPFIRSLMGMSWAFRSLQITHPGDACLQLAQKTCRQFAM